MEKIASFTIDHLKLLPGVYVSRKDKVGQQVITTFDIRMTRLILNLFLILQKFIQLSILAQHF